MKSVGRGGGGGISREKGVRGVCVVGGVLRDTRGVQMYSSAIKCTGAGQTDVTFNECKTRGGNGLMDGYKVSPCNQMSL